MHQAQLQLGHLCKLCVTKKPMLPMKCHTTVVLNASEEQDGTFYFCWEGMYHILLSRKISIYRRRKINELGWVTFEVKGIYGDTIEGLPLPEPDFSGFQDPLPLSNSNTKFTLDAQALNLYEYELNDNHNVEHDEGTEQSKCLLKDWSEEGNG